MLSAEVINGWEMIGMPAARGGGGARSDPYRQPVGMAVYVSDAMVSGVGADDIVVQLADALDQASPDQSETIGRLLEVVEAPLAMEI